MATTKHLQVVIGANAEAAIAGIGKVTTSLKAMKTSAGGVFGALSSFASLPNIGATLSLAGLAYGMKKGLDDVVEMKHASDTLGVSLAKIGGLKSMAGGNWEGMEKGLGKMLQHLGEAKLGSRDAAKGFELLGLKIEDLNHLKTESIFGAIADKLRAIEDPAMRADAAAKIFGKSWESMMPALEKGSEGLEAAAKRANVFGELTEDAARKAELAKVKISMLGIAWDAFWRKTATTAVDVAMIHSGMGAHSFAFPGGPAVDPIKNAVDAASAAAAAKTVEGIGALVDKLQQEADGAGKAGHAVEDFARQHKNATPAMLATAKALEDKINAQKKDEELTKKAAAVMEHLLTPYQKLQEEIAEVQMLHDKGKLAADQYAMAMGHIGEEILKLDKTNQKLDFKGSEGLERGSAGAFSAQERFVRESEGGADKSHDLVEAVKRQEAIQRKVEQNTKSAADALKKFGVAKF